MTMAMISDLQLSKAGRRSNKTFTMATIGPSQHSYVGEARA
jgi:hypothetical protein